MKLDEWKKINGLKSDEDIRLFLRNNMLSGGLPVAIASCLICNEIVEDYSLPHNCKGDN